MERTAAMQEAIENANAHLNNAGLPTYSELLGALCQCAEGYTGARGIKATDKARELVERIG